jgi:predicted O-methyltransferase YrrM
LKLKAQQPQQERLGLYALVAGLQPTTMLEIGSAEGGSASIAVKAMDAINKGRLFCIEPHPKIEPEVWAAIEHRATLIEGFSPYVTPEVAQMAQAPFDLVFIDGYHNEEQVGKDIDGCLPFLADTAYLLFHDSYNDEVRRGVDAAIQRHPAVLQDCGIIFRARSFFYDDWWCGMRLVAYSKAGFLEVRS